MGENNNSMTTFLQSIDQLYAQFLDYSLKSALTTQSEPITIAEEAYGEYTANKLILLDQAKNKIAELLPRGASVIGANGRVDLVGKNDQIILVNLESDGPSITSTIGVNGNKQSLTRYLYRNVEAAGWYWIEDKRRGKAHIVSDDLITELLWRVSGYER